MRKPKSPASVRSARRTALLTSAAALAVVSATPALAQQSVVLQEGTTVQGDVKLDGVDRLIVDISRIDADTAELNLGEFEGRPALLTGSVTSAAGEDALWLRAVTSQTRDVVYTTVGSSAVEQRPTAGTFEFTGGLVYEAAGNDTVLTLKNRSREASNPVMALKHAPLTLAGDGTIVLDFTIQADQGDASVPDRAIQVALIDPVTGDGKLDLVVKEAIDGNTGLNAEGLLDENIGLIDVRYANSLRLTEDSRVTVGNHTAILGGDAEIIIDRGALLALKSPSGEGSHPGLLIRSSGVIRNAGRIDATDNGDSPTSPGQVGDRGVGLRLEGAEFYNTLTEGRTGTGEVWGGLHAVVSSTGSNLIHNVGLIKSVNGAAIAAYGGLTVLRNADYTFADGSRRSGEIIGGIVDGLRVAYKDYGYNQDVVVNSGRIEGDVRLGNYSDTFLYTGASNGVIGLIDGGAGDTDAYGVSVGDSGTIQFRNDLNTGNTTNFELHGVELNGANLTVVAESAAGVTLANGIKALGRGTFINRADVADPTGVGLMVEYQHHRLARGLDLVNEADLTSFNGVLAYGLLHSFTNRGTVNSTDSAFHYYLESDQAQPLKFLNEGELLSGDPGGDTTYTTAKIYIIDETGDPTKMLAEVTNKGLIRNTFSSSDPSAYGVGYGLSLSNVGTGRMSLLNSGTVETLGSGGVAVSTSGGGYGLTNRNTIQSTGAGGGGVLMYGANGIGRDDTLLNESAGVIRANAGGIDGMLGRTFAFGVGASGISNGGRATVTNAGLIEATGDNSIAVAAIGLGSPGLNKFEIVNTGTIRGRGFSTVDEGVSVSDGTLGLAGVLGDEDEVRYVAGAIQTWRTTDLIRNFGSIIGGVDLGAGDDRFEHYGEVDGFVSLSDGDDTLVLGDGVFKNGSASDGGNGNDVILADLSGDQDRTITADQFRNFETIRRLEGPLGTARLFVEGFFSVVDTLNLDNVDIHVAAGKEVQTTQFTAFRGGAGSESITNDGRISGNVALGAGDDRLTNAGYVEYVDMGDGDDVVINSGRIQGDLLLGDGDDRYEAIGQGLVTGAIDGGAGNDTFVFRLAGSTGSIPGGFDGFESFAAYGPGTLKLILDRDYTNLEILEGANLELTNADEFDVELIKGDDSAQSVKIDAGFTGSVRLFGGDDTLEMSLGGLLAGDLDGGDGDDTLRLNLTAASSINDLFGFETVAVAGASPLTLTGTLGEGQKIEFDDSNNEFIIAENAVFRGSADGGGGSDILRVATGAAVSRTIVSGQLTSFESLYASGAGTLEFNGGNHRFNTFEVDGGNIAFMNGAKLAAGSGSILFTGNANNRFTLGYGSSIGSRVDGGDGDRDVLEFNQGAGQTQKVSDLNAENFEILAASGAGYLNIDQDVTFTEVQLEGGNVRVLKDVTLTADVIGGAGNDTFDNAGTVDGDVLLGDGDDTYVARTGSSVTGRVDGGIGGNDTVVYSLIDGAGSLLDDFINFESLGVYGPGTLTLDMQQGENWNSVKLLEGANLDLKSSGGTIGQIIGDDSSQTVNIDGALTGGVSLGGGDDTLGLTLNGVLSGALDGGAGNDVLNLKLTGQSSINGMYGFETANISGGYALTLGGELGAGQRINFDGSNDELIIAAGATFAGTVDGGAGQNLLRVQSGAAESRTVVASQILNFQDLISEGSGVLALTGGNYAFDSVQVDGGSLELGANTVLKSKTRVTFDGADNRLVLGAGSNIEGGVDAGAGNDTIALAQAQGQVRTWSTLQAAGFERLEASGAGELRLDIDARFDNGVSLNGGVTTIAAPATLTANVTGGDAAETFAILGTLNGDLDLGAGDDRLIFAANGSGERKGGTGTDTLEFRGSNSAIVNYDGSLWTGFEKLAVSGGTLSMTGVSDWQGLTLTGGRLVGQAGSVITSSSAIEVGAGSVFGSAGTVNADINVRGTLSPGASPGTMTVNGDVSFFAGSNLLMELSPQASDLLMINGAMNIASGATIDITGVLPSTPGQVLDLIVASEGINGRFTTVNKSSSVFGFVSQNGNKLQIRGEFQNNAGFGSNAQNSIAYANAVLGSGQAVQAYTQAVPVLVDANGVSNAAAFAQLTPEAYGSAMAMQTETALSGVDAGRSLLAEAPRGAGKFAFARGYGASTGLDGRASTGAASADIDLGAAYAGVGYVSPEGGVVGGFVGFTNSEQSLKDLGAETKADGMIAGAFLAGELGGVRMGAQLTYEQADASTSRLISAAGGTAKGEYDMESVAIDASMSYPIQLSGWTVAPTVGATWVSARRDAVSEVSATSFGLAVDQDRSDTLFTDIGVRASTVMSMGGSALTPFAELGLRTIQNDGGERVTGTLKGVNGFEMDVDGVRRDRSVARVAAGVSYDLGGVRLDAGYAGEFGDATRHTFGAGVSVRF